MRERATQTLHTVAKLLAVPVRSQDMHDAVLLCDERLFTKIPDLLICT